MIDNVCAIIADRATPAQINAIQELVKERAKGWWHRFDQLWLVGGPLTARQWRDAVKPLMLAGGASVLVLKLPQNFSERDWAFFGPGGTDRCAWIHKNYR